MNRVHELTVRHTREDPFRVWLAWFVGLIGSGTSWTVKSVTRRVALLILLLASAISCSPVDAHAIRADFERTHAGCHVKALAVGEGDSDNVYVRIKYRCGKETTLREEAWLYQRVGKEWKPKAKVPNGSIK